MSAMEEGSIILKKWVSLLPAIKLDGLWSELPLGTTPLRWVIDLLGTILRWIRSMMRKPDGRIWGWTMPSTLPIANWCLQGRSFYSNDISLFISSLTFTRFYFSLFISSPTLIKFSSLSTSLPTSIKLNFFNYFITKLNKTQISWIFTIFPKYFKGLRFGKDVQ